MRYLVLAAWVAGCSGSAPTNETTQGLLVCQSPDGVQTAFLQRCSRKTADGIDCHICRDYAGCIVGRGESVTYCVSAADNCNDPACSF